MIDPHIESLIYSVKPSEFVEYENPPPLKFETDIFEGTLENHVLTCSMKAHFPTENEARAAIEGTLRAWEIDAALRRGRPDIAFVFQKSALVDRNPSKDRRGNQVVFSASLKVSGTYHLVVKTGLYPPPPQSFYVTPDVEALWTRYEGYLRGREPLLPMAYFCLTVIEAAHSGRANTAKQLNVEEAILRKMGELTSTRGDPSTARKMRPQSTKQPLSGAENTWLEEALKALIRQLAEVHSSTSPRNLNMKDLPTIQ